MLSEAFWPYVQCRQCRGGWWEGPTPSQWSTRHQVGSVLWAICTLLACFSHVFSLECLPNNGMGVLSVGKGQETDRVDMWPGPPVLENGISERQALGKSCSHYIVGRSEFQPTCSNSRLHGQGHYDDSRRWETFSVDFTVCKFQTG